MSADDAVLLAMQAPSGIPRSKFFDTTTDPLLPPGKTADMLAHFFDQVYDLRPESHLSRLLKVILGDTGTGGLRKRYTYAHLSQFILTTHYNDLDLLYGNVFGLKRLFRERLDIEPYLEAVTDDQWQAIDAADGSYRARIEAFSHALPWAGTPTGMAIAASAVLAEEVRVYESYAFIDDQDIYVPNTGSPLANDYLDLEARGRYADLEGRTYAELEGQNIYEGRLANSRGEFVVRPLRTISNEEQFHLIKALNRLKPAEALLTIDARPAAVHTRVPVYRAIADSTYWHIKSRVRVNPKNKDLYQAYSDTEEVEQPKAAFSAYQGEAWSYNADVSGVRSYAEDEDGTEVQGANFERRVTAVGDVYDYSPDQALSDPIKILLGRYVSDGIMATVPVIRSGVVG